MKVRVVQVLIGCSLFPLSSCKVRQFNQTSSPKENLDKPTQTPWQKTTFDVHLLKKLYEANDLSGLETSFLRPELQASLTYLELRLKNPSVDSKSRKNFEALLTTGRQLQTEPVTLEKLGIFSNSLACALTQQQDTLRDTRMDHNNITHDRCDDSRTKTSVEDAFKRAESFNVWLLPTWADLNVSQFSELLTFPIMPIGITFKSRQGIDGVMGGPSSFFSHDLGHFATMESAYGVREFFAKDAGKMQRKETVKIAKFREAFLAIVKNNLAEKYTLARVVFDTILFDFFHEDFYGPAPASRSMFETSTISKEFRQYLNTKSTIFKEFKAESASRLPRSQTKLSFREVKRSFSTLIDLFSEAETNTDVKLDKVVDNILAALDDFQSAIPGK